MHERMIKSAPGPTLRRLPAYHRVLKQLARRGRESASCTTIARELASDPTQVRKDLSVTGLPGKPKVGYPVKELIAAIEEFLGWNNVSDAFLVGAGNLGAALLGFEGFENHGLNIVAAFDTDPRKVNATIHGKTVLPMDKMFDLAARLHVQIGILTVPAGAAQEVANMLILAGIRASGISRPCASRRPRASSSRTRTFRSAWRFCPPAWLRPRETN